MIRICYVDTDRTGGGLEVTGAEGIMRVVTEEPHGVVVTVNGLQLSITKNALPEIGKFFLAAAIRLGEDIDPPLEVTK